MGVICGVGEMIDFDHLVLWLSPRKVMGSWLPDLSRYKNNGRIYGAELRHGAMWFDGVNAYINCGNSTTLDTPNAITVEIWLYPLPGTPKWAGYISKLKAGDYAGWAIQRAKIDTEIRWFGFGDNSNDLRGTVQLYAWNFIAGTWDGDEMQLYVNCVLQGTLSTTGNIATNTEQLHIGKLNYTTSGYNAKCFIGDIMVYSVARTAEQIRIDASLTSPYGTR